MVSRPRFEPARDVPPNLHIQPCPHIGLDGNVTETLPAAVSVSVTLPDAPTEKPFGTRERDSLLKLVIGIAVKGYGYDPKASRTGTAREIAGDLQLLGIPLDEDTVRKFLTDAKALLPSIETEQND